MTCEADCYSVSWYSRADLPESAYRTREDAGNGWWRYRKTVPINSIKSLKEIEFPNDPTMCIVQVEIPNGRLP